MNEASEEGITVIEQELARLAIASVGEMFVRLTKLVTDASILTQTLVGQYPCVPLFSFLYGYAAFTVVLSLSTAACASDVIGVGAWADATGLEKPRVVRWD